MAGTVRIGPVYGDGIGWKPVGAKTALLVYTDGDPADLLRRPATPDVVKTGELVAATHPGWIRSGGMAGGFLSDHIYPPEGLVYAGSFPGVDVLCDRAVMADRPSQLPAQFHLPGAGRRMILHVMHSVSDWFGYALWHDGTLLRSLSLAPDGGIIEDIGDRQPFEAAFWAGEHPVIPASGRASYPLPFHPLELGEVALHELMGFTLEGRQAPSDVQAEAVRLLKFTVPPDNPVTQADVDAFRRTHRRTTYTIGPDGSLTPA
jgi:hypothetical protein